MGVPEGSCGASNRGGRSGGRGDRTWHPRSPPRSSAPELGAIERYHPWADKRRELTSRYKIVAQLALRPFMRLALQGLALSPGSRS